MQSVANCATSLSYPISFIKQLTQPSLLSSSPQTFSIFLFSLLTLSKYFSVDSCRSFSFKRFYLNAIYFCFASLCFQLTLRQDIRFLRLIGQCELRFMFCNEVERRCQDERLCNGLWMRFFYARRDLNLQLVTPEADIILFFWGRAFYSRPVCTSDLFLFSETSFSQLLLLGLSSKDCLILFFCQYKIFFWLISLRLMNQCLTLQYNLLSFLSYLFDFSANYYEVVLIVVILCAGCLQRMADQVSMRLML